MRLTVQVLAGLVFGMGVVTEGHADERLHRVRSLDSVIRATLIDGCRRSATFAALVDDLERSSLVVYVEQVPTLSHDKRGVLLHGGTGTGYLRVLLKRGLSRDHRVSVLAHELQHVREVAEAGVVADRAQVEQVFRTIGDAGLSGGRRQQYETAAALAMGRTVLSELRAVRAVGHAPSGRCFPHSAPNPDAPRSSDHGAVRRY